jgi:hypothetical protein
MERSGSRRSLLRGEGLTDAQPREGEFHGGYRGPEPVGGGAFLLRDGLLGLTLSATGGYLLAGVGGRGGCCCHVWLFSRGKLILEPRKDCFSRGAFGANKPAIAEALTPPPHRGYAPARTAPPPPRIATASTHHRRDEQSNADGNLTGQI